MTVTSYFFKLIFKRNINNRYFDFSFLNFTASKCSLESGIFPYKVKTARVIPLFKARDPATISNYRSISVFPCFSKIWSELCASVYINILQQKKFHTLNTLVFKQAIQQSTHLSI